MPVEIVSMANFLSMTPLETVQLCAEQGFDGIEVFCDLPFCNPDEFDKAQREELARVIELADLAVAGHGPLWGIDLCCANPGIWKESIRQNIEAARLIHELGGDRLVVHSGRLAGNPPGVKDRLFSRAVEGLCMVRDEARRLGVTVFVENNGFNGSGWEESLEEFLDLVETAFVGVCLDTGHANITWGLTRTIEALGNRIGHIHIDDNDGISDQHLPAGEGTIDFGGIREFLRGFEGQACHELRVDDDPVGGTLRSRDSLKKILKAD